MDVARRTMLEHVRIKWRSQYSCPSVGLCSCFPAFFLPLLPSFLLAVTANAPSVCDRHRLSCMQEFQDQKYPSDRSLYAGNGETAASWHLCGTFVAYFPRGFETFRLRMDATFVPVNRIIFLRLTVLGHVRGFPFPVSTARLIKFLVDVG